MVCDGRMGVLPLSFAAFCADVNGVAIQELSTLETRITQAANEVRVLELSLFEDLCKSVRFGLACVSVGYL